MAIVKGKFSHSSMASSSATEISTSRLKQPLHFYSVQFLCQSNHTSKFFKVEWEYRDGINIKTDKIGLPCTYRTSNSQHRTHNCQPKRINDTSPILSQRQTVNRDRSFNVPVASKTSSSASSSNS